MDENSLRLTEIFYSLQGESSTVGQPTAFIRLTGCPLRCQYCDTAYAFRGGKWFSLETILSKVADFGARYVCVTGGEPLAQPKAIELLRALCDTGYYVSLETSGALDISAVDSRVMIVMDLKTPGSGEEGKNLLTNLDYLKPTDEIKFVLSHREDYDWAAKMIKNYQLTDRAKVLFSPSWHELNPQTLADWIVHDKIQVRFQMQLHKILWHDLPGH
ncbi:MAG: 7-carboxy-7-deazaguanine synthase QueE [Legionella sp.]|nr:7-carboxy-7-deazaguanine synthase QueE [Legionella sp.]